MDPRRWTWKEADLPKKLLEKLTGRFLIGIYEAALSAQPADVPVLVALGDLYTRQGLVEKGLEIDKRLVEVRPEEPTFHYNLACSHSLLGNIDTAFEALQRAIQLGYDRFEQLSADPDLENLRRDVRWRQMLRKLPDNKLSG